VAIPLDAQKWMIVLPPEGAARQVGESVWKSFGRVLPESRRKLFDTKAYQDAYDRLLKSPEDDMVVDLLNQSLIVQALDFEATHLLVLALSPVTAFASDLLRRRGLVTLHWFYEDFRQAKYWRDVLPTYTHFLAIQRGPVEAACREKGVAFHYLPTATGGWNSSGEGGGHHGADECGSGGPAAGPKPWKERTGGVVFVGFPSPYRTSALEALAAAGIPLRIAGSGWEKYRGPLESLLEGSGWAGPERVRALLGEARAALHLPYEDPAIDRDNSHLSPRVFDVLAAGCVLLCEDAPLIRESLRGCAYREFRGAAEAVEAARATLAEGLPQETLDANRDTALREHTYARRIAYLRSINLP
jgi:hypothetical protein